ncbi:MAG: cysteine desulfurase family protein [Planctomycetota bacterium]
MIYADHNATTPPLPDVIAAMTTIMAEGWGNAGSRQHARGRSAGAAVDAARAEIAALIGAQPAELTFTSGATEGCNLALFGLGERLLTTRPRIVTCATEHAAVVESVRRLGEAGAEVVTLGVNGDGQLNPAELAAAVNDRTGLVALMLANNETGVIHDVAAASAIAHHHGALLVCDGTQGVGKLPVDVTQLGVDALAFTAHKMYGPQGCGALWLRRGLGCSPQLVGGSQERGVRGGTLNLPGIVGFGVAAAHARRDLTARRTHLTTLSAQFEARIRTLVPEVNIQGARSPRIPGTSMCTVPGLPSGWLATLSTVAASGGSTCSGGHGSPILRAMGCNAHDAGNSIRIGLGIGTTADDVETIAQELMRGAAALRRG